jgi:hypothetical protein
MAIGEWVLVRLIPVALTKNEKAQACEQICVIGPLHIYFYLKGKFSVASGHLI